MHQPSGQGREVTGNSGTSGSFHVDSVAPAPKCQPSESQQVEGVRKGMWKLGVGFGEVYIYPGGVAGAGKGPP